MTRWGKIKCPRCDDTFQMYVDANEARIDAEAKLAETDALWEGMERSLEESDAREARLEARIEELEAALPEQIEWVKRLADDLNAAEGREARLKAKLAKSLRALERIELSTDTREQGAIAMATLAELKGQGDE